MFYFVLVLMFGWGAYLFIRGFRIYWEFRVLKNIPLSAVRGLAMGLVRVRGRATGAETLTSPVSRQPCYFYSLRVAKWETDSRNRPYWRRWATDSDMVKFYLEDETGKVLLNPRGAELELERPLQQIIDGELPDTLFGSSHRRESSESGRGTGDSSGGEPANERSQLELIASLAKVGAKPEPGRFRLTEYCILPEATYEVAGTCGQNSLAKDDADRNQIKKGIGESIFMITDKDSLEKTLDHRAVASIFGGAFLTILAAALMLLLAQSS